MNGASVVPADTVTSDVLVAGTGAGGLATALAASRRGLDVIIVEKEPLFGGTIAYSAGVIWIPGNHHLPEADRAGDRAGRPIEGLYAVGNDAASVMGGTYPGGGVTIGPAVTFGYIAANDMADATPVLSHVPVSHTSAPAR
jgi:succinate dehydrogenase/fumarate reductase flavoprotein subunit